MALCCNSVVTMVMQRVSDGAGDLRGAAPKWFTLSLVQQQYQFACLTTLDTVEHGSPYHCHPSQFGYRLCSRPLSHYISNLLVGSGPTQVRLRRTLTPLLPKHPMPVVWYSIRTRASHILAPTPSPRTKRRSRTPAW